VSGCTRHGCMNPPTTSGLCAHHQEREDSKWTAYPTEFERDYLGPMLGDAFLGTSQPDREVDPFAIMNRADDWRRGSR
jgi:hypothetical protein